MALVFKRIMIVTQNVQFAIDTKRALESLGDYAVTTVTNASHAVERLKNQAHNLVVLDIENVEAPPTDIIKLIRKIQKEIAIVLAPNVPDAHDIASTLDVNYVIDIPTPIRQLIPVLEDAIRVVFDNLPDTVVAPAVDVPPQETVYIETLVDDLLGDDETPYFTNYQIQAQKINPLPEDQDTTQRKRSTLEIFIESSQQGETVQFVQSDDTYGDRSLRLFQKLAEEEPPMPGVAENGTISDLARSVTQSKSMPVLETDETETEAHNVDDDNGSGQIPAILVLQTALDQTTPIEAISLQTLYDNIQERLPPDKQSIRPLPSWLKEGEKFVREPSFLEEPLVMLDSQRPMEYTSTLTQPSDGIVVVSNAGDLETEVIESISPTVDDDLSDAFDLDQDDTPPETAEPLTESEPSEMVDVAEDSVDDQTPAEADAPEDSINEGAIDEEEAELPVDAPKLNIETDDPFVAQMAVTLTQVSTDLTAEATILTRDNVMVAYSGEMPIEDIEELRETIHEDWGVGLDNARIRFITLASSGKDYMLYSKGTVGGFTLSMVFAGTKQLRVIRRQGERLINALQATPEMATLSDEPDVPVAEAEVEQPPVEEAIEEPVAPLTPQEVMGFEGDEAPAEPEEVEPIDVGPKLPFTFVWIVEDFEVILSEALAQKIVFWLEVQLNSLHWTIHQLNVHQDFIYLHADVPGDLSPSALIRNLMERSEKIALSEDDTLPEKLWADAYLVLTPGREMTDREIQRFLNFARDEG